VAQGFTSVAQPLSREVDAAPFLEVPQHRPGVLKSIEISSRKLLSPFRVLRDLIPDSQVTFVFLGRVRARRIVYAVVVMAGRWTEQHLLCL